MVMMMMMMMMMMIMLAIEIWHTKVRHSRVQNVRLIIGQCYVSPYNDVIMSTMASQITSFTIVYSSVYSGTDQRKHQSSASLAFVWGIHRWQVNSPHEWPVTRTMLPFDDVIMYVKILNVMPPLQSSLPVLVVVILRVNLMVLKVSRHGHRHGQLKVFDLDISIMYICYLINLKFSPRLIP